MNVAFPWAGHRPGRTSFWSPTLLGAAGGVLAGVILGIGVVLVNPLYVVGGLLGLAFLVAVFRDVRFGLYGFVAVATLLPFAVVPVPIGSVKLTMVDVCLTSVLLVWLLRLMAQRGERLIGSGSDLPVVLFVGVCVTAFVLGTAYQTSSADARLFLKLLNSIIFFFSVVNVVRDVATLRRVILALVAGTTAAAVLAIGLYYLPAATATRYLAALSHLGYPDSGILQYIASTSIQRAIGTSIDPNILGATLMIGGTLAVGLLVTPRSSHPWLRWAIAGALVPILGALLLTYSRGSFLGFLAGCLVIATLRERRLWLVAVAAGALLLGSDAFLHTDFLSHLISGVEVQDQAAAMRLGEYKDAFRLIQQYPWFGVGYGSAPNVDLYIGVSSIYLLIAENDGLIGLAIWLIAMGSIAWRGIRATLSGLAASRLWAPRDLTRAAAATEVASYVVSCLGALASILVAGLFDHHFVDIQFPHVVALVWLIAGLLMVGVRLSPGLAYNGGVAEVEADSDAHRDLGLRTRRSAASM